MLDNAKRDIENLRLHVVTVLPSLCLSVWNVGESGSHKLEILETNCTDN